MVNPLPGSVAENDTLFDACAGSLQPNTGAYGYRVMPPCLHSGSSSVPEVYYWAFNPPPLTKLVHRFWRRSRPQFPAVIRVCFEL